MTDQYGTQDLPDGQAPATTPVTPGRTNRRRIAGIATVAGSLLLGLGMVAVAVAATGPAGSGDVATGGFLASTPLSQLVNTTGTEGSGGTWGPGPDGGRGFGRGDRMGARGGHLSDAAAAIGITEEALRTELASGKTIAAVAEAKGVAVDTVVAAIVAAEKTEIAEAVTAGRLTQAQADELLANVEQHATDIVNGTFDGRGGPGGPGCGPDGSAGTGLRGGMGFLGGADQADELAAVAKALGLSGTEVQTKLQAGSSLAEIATAENVDVQKVIDALVAVEKAEIADAVKAGSITQDQADRMTANVTQRVTEMVNGTFRGGRGGHGGHGGRGHGGGMGDPAPSGTGTSTNG